MSKSNSQVSFLLFLIFLPVLGGCTLSFVPTPTPLPEPVVLPTSDVTPADLQGVTWLLQSMGEDELAEGTHVTIRFTDGVMEGYAGCRGYRGFYQANGGTISFLTFNMLGETSCADKELLAQETLFIDYLELSTRYRVDAGRLEIYTSGNETLIFAAEQQPVE
ncbi:MAG: META domain-containing protein [Chloroflexi bacterium]|nr:META domain-containing protein [Chloroflexota bacterium]